MSRRLEIARWNVNVSGNATDRAIANDHATERGSATGTESGNEIETATATETERGKEIGTLEECVDASALRF